MPYQHLNFAIIIVQNYENKNRFERVCPRKYLRITKYIHLYYTAILHPFL